MVMEVQLVVDEESQQFDTRFVFDGGDGVVEAAEVGEVSFFDV